jgi:hypothetical protein
VSIADSNEQNGSPEKSDLSSMADKENDIHDETLQIKEEEVIEDDSNYVTGLRLGLIVIGLTLSILLVALVRFQAQPF